jgi:hypothetical protein
MFTTLPAALVRSTRASLYLLVDGCRFRALPSLGDTYDEATGTVTLSHTSLQSLRAAQAGKRVADAMAQGATLNEACAAERTTHEAQVRAALATDEFDIATNYAQDADLNMYDVVAGPDRIVVATVQRGVAYSALDYARTDGVAVAGVDMYDAGAIAVALGLAK